MVLPRWCRRRQIDVLEAPEFLKTCLEKRESKEERLTS
jgi:hypothetical protein